MASTYRMVAYGSQGDAVRQLQGELNKHGYQLNEDGIFGKKTRSAVRDYQRKNNLRLDGIAGDETWGSLMAPAPAEPEAPGICACFISCTSVSLRTALRAAGKRLSR